MHTLRIAAVVMNAPLGRTEYNLKRMIALIHEAKRLNADLVCFPEMTITGYSSGEPAKKLALSKENDAIFRLKQEAQQLGVTILAGMAEKDSNERIFASHYVLYPDGSQDLYRKIHIAPPEKGTYTRGLDIPVFETKGFRFGIQLCYDAHFPELSSRMTEKGIDVLFIPHASPRLTPEEKHDSWMRHLPARAFDNSIYVVACNQCGENGNGLFFPGISVVIEPSGRVLDRMLTTEDKIMVADLKRKDLDYIRNHEMRYFFPNRIEY